jgi:two-component sensor histidine kinase
MDFNYNGPERRRVHNEQKAEGSACRSVTVRKWWKAERRLTAHRRLLNETASTDVEAVVQGAVLPLSPDPKQVEVSGPHAMLRSQKATSLTLGLHELATNALKYGALSVPTGRMEIRWSLEPGERGKVLQLLWRERGGPLVRRPSRRGFGTRMIEGSLAHELGAAVSIEFNPEGILVHLTAELVESATITKLAKVESA